MKKIWLIPIGILQPILWWSIWFIIQKNVGDSAGLDVSCVMCAFLTVIAVLLIFLRFNNFLD